MDICVFGIVLIIILFSFANLIVGYSIICKCLKDFDKVERGKKL